MQLQAAIKKHQAKKSREDAEHNKERDDRGVLEKRGAKRRNTRHFACVVFGDEREEVGGVWIKRCVEVSQAMMIVLLCVECRGVRLHTPDAKEMLKICDVERNDGGGG